MWMPWAFFFCSPAHRLTGSRQAVAKPSQGSVSGKAVECYFQNVFCGGKLWTVTSKRFSFWKGLFLICQTAFPNGKPFVCNIPKPFQRENTLSPAHRLTGSSQAVAKPSQEFVSGRASECYLQQVFCLEMLFLFFSVRGHKNIIFQASGPEKILFFPGSRVIQN